MRSQFLQRVLPDDWALGEAVADAVKALLAADPARTISIAAGTSSLPAFRAILRRIALGEMSLARARFFAMDEWLGVPREREGSMYDFLTRNFLADAGFSEAFLFDGMADPAGEIRRAQEFLGGKPLDFLLFGVGMNGHIALNEPGCPENGSMRVVEVSPVTARVGQKYFGPGGAELKKGVTLGMREAMEGKRVLLAANTPEKKEVVQKILDSPPTSAIPATLLKRRGDVEFLITRSVLEN